VTQQATLSDYEAVGGGPAVKVVVEDFYTRVLADTALAPYFVGVDLPRLKRHQALLVTKVLGGPDGYYGRSLRDAHHGMDITAGDFARVVDHLVAALRGAGVPEAIIERAGAVVLDTKPEIVTRL
jgi:hemoglobin